MYKLLIADDEAKIWKGLRNSLEWDKLNVEVVGEAEDEEIALYKTVALKPNLIFMNVILEQKRIKSGIYGVTNTYNDIISNLDKITLYKPVVVLAIKYINTNYYVKHLSLDTVSEKFRVSSSYLSKLLKQETGFSFIDYLTKYRIKKSIGMMDDPKLKIYEVAEAVGYNNQHYFCKAFKKVTRVAPTEYRGGNV